MRKFNTQSWQKPLLETALNTSYMSGCLLASAPLHTQDTEIGLGALVWQPQPSFSISDRSRQDKALL